MIGGGGIRCRDGTKKFLQEGIRTTIKYPENPIPTFTDKVLN